MSDVRWEPVKRTGYIDDRGGLLRAHTDDDGTQYIGATSSEIAESGWVKMPDKPTKLRLCRAVAAPTWSQEPPTDCDRIWVWRPKWKRPLWADVRPHSYDPMVLVLVMENGLRVPLSEMPRDTWYMPATVPQPPGEVGEVGG